MKVFVDVVTSLFYLGVLVGVAAAALTFLSMLSESESAPQQAAGAATAMCYAVIPYVLARAVEKILGTFTR